MNLIDERKWIQKGLLFYWDCNICHQLGWDKERKCNLVRKDCNYFVYQKLQQHFSEWLKLSRAGK